MSISNRDESAIAATSRAIHASHAKSYDDAKPRIASSGRTQGGETNISGTGSPHPSALCAWNICGSEYGSPWLSSRCDAVQYSMKSCLGRESANRQNNAVTEIARMEIATLRG